MVLRWAIIHVPSGATGTYLANCDLYLIFSLRVLRHEGSKEGNMPFFEPTREEVEALDLLTDEIPEI
jgi:hypothetical protein